MLRLKGRVVYGELEGDWIKFDVNQIDGVAGDGIGLRVRSSDRNIFIIDPATIQPADDPRKAMLDEIRAELNREYLFDSCDRRNNRRINSVLDEMEAKL